MTGANLNRAAVITGVSVNGEDLGWLMGLEPDDRNHNPGLYPGYSHH